MATSTKGMCPACPAIVHWPSASVTKNWRFRCWNCKTDLKPTVREEIDQDGVVTEIEYVVIDE